MNSKIAHLLAANIGNRQIITEMIMHICIKDNAIENHLIDLCLSGDDKFITETTLLQHIDKLKPLCMKYMSNIIDIDNIKVKYIDNIASEVMVTFKAQATAWFKDKESADKGYSWYSVSQEDNEHKIKGTYTTTCDTYISFKDIDLE